MPESKKDEKKASAMTHFFAVVPHPLALRLRSEMNRMKLKPAEEYGRCDDSKRVRIEGASADVLVPDFRVGEVTDDKVSRLIDGLEAEGSEGGEIRAPNGRNGESKEADGQGREEEARDAAHQGRMLEEECAKNAPIFSSSV